MTILKISEDIPENIKTIKQAIEPFACLLSDACLCEPLWFRDTATCVGIALVGRNIGYMRRAKRLVEYELSRQYGCPVRVFKDEDNAMQWLSKQLTIRQ